MLLDKNVDTSSYTAGYLTGYEQCKTDRRMKEEAKKIHDANIRRRKLYVLLQKLFGMMLLGFGVLFAVMADGIWGICALIIIALPCLRIIFTREEIFAETAAYLAEKGGD